MAKYILTIYQSDSDKKWRWRANSKANGKIVGSSGQGFTTKYSAKRNAGLNGFTE
ncbi:hypothetical protein [Flavobacterium alkalisoli]|uniref:hypothetical protein n=1 Tax=Flavobacterium alkalisoli TaxID=2602769 RepID=UPI00143DA4C0|nr:hypothetical protein [Flavobacterium alkalisoli]